MILVPPTRLQTGTDYNAAIPSINNNFDELLAQFSGITVNLSQVGAGGGPIGAGGLATDQFSALTLVGSDDIVFIVPTIALYVDFPDAFFSGDTSSPPGNQYLYPNGASITSDGLGILTSTMVTISKTGIPLPNGATADSTIEIDGRDWREGAGLITMTRNAGSSTHNYWIVLSYSSYSKSNSFYR